MNTKQNRPIIMEFQSQESSESQGRGTVEKAEKGPVPESLGVRRKFNGRDALFEIFFYFRYSPFSISTLPQWDGAGVSFSNQEIRTSREVNQVWITGRGCGLRDTQGGYQSACEGKSQKQGRHILQD